MCKPIALRNDHFSLLLLVSSLGPRPRARHQSSRGQRSSYIMTCYCVSLGHICVPDLIRVRERLVEKRRSLCGLLCVFGPVCSCNQSNWHCVMSLICLNYLALCCKTTQTTQTTTIPFDGHYLRAREADQMTAQGNGFKSSGHANFL